MSSAYSLAFIFFGYSYLSLLRLQIIVHTGKCIPITIGPGIYQEHMNEALDVLSNGGCVWVIFLQGNVSGGNRTTCANLKTFNLSHTMLIQGDTRESGRGDLQKCD
jgi:hypothetical protein